MAGHYAKSCPQSVKRKADGPADDDAMVHMVADDDNPDYVQQVNMHEDDGEESEPDDTGIWDCGAASVLVSRMQLKRYLRQLRSDGWIRRLWHQSLDLQQRFPFWNRQQGQDQYLRFAAYVV